MHAFHTDIRFTWEKNILKNILLKSTLNYNINKVRNFDTFKNVIEFL